MPTITASVDEATKSKFAAMAAARKTTPSRLAASLFQEFIEEDSTPSFWPESRDPETEAQCNAGIKTRCKQVFVRLQPRYYEQLGQLARERNWYRGTYLANLFYAHADRRPVLGDDEINGLRQVARQLADMGRNINQIARTLNTSMEHAHLVKSLDFDLIQMLIELEANAVKTLLRANIKGWGRIEGEQ